ncbi:acyl-CoA carboxylase subunit beta [Capillimicrobium parvum]|uniref:Methylmalonyl-CoA carboxyltransferase 12S subunit n=1 Tax=Capillimicrobium parvum TaxID=2884022 RepID=A0A9E7C188_9ACTN|nr:carboxyl transferase domain-containing protein [Capillimicrobium parvum]UGS36419.1 Methylmalonyl-CoA carboxyltransferase 12S subunit [Capillimicrobium parvum]
MSAPAAARPAAAPPAPVRLRPAERLRLLCDPGTLRLDEVPAGGPVPSVLGAAGDVGGRPVACYAHDAAVAGGSVGAAEADVVVATLRRARRDGVPVVGFVESAGARLQEGALGLDAYARILFEDVAGQGVVPQVSVVTGTAAGGGCYSPALTDFIVMTRDATMFLTGPRVVREALGEDVAPAELGGARVHERNGVCHVVAEDEAEAITVVQELLGHLPSHAGGAVPQQPAAAPAPGRPDAFVPRDPRRVYDIRDVARTIVDGGRLLEIAPGWATNLVTAFARLGGQSIGVVANQPRSLGGILDAEAARKGAAFVDACTAFGVPLVVLVDTPGFMPGRRQETNGIIRHGAGLVRAFAASPVPRATVILRKAYGGAYIAMNSAGLGATVTFAWPSAEIGIMGARAAARILGRRDIAAAVDPGAALDGHARRYGEQHLSVGAARAAGLVDEVVDPGLTRARLAAALARPARR